MHYQIKQSMSSDKIKLTKEQIKLIEQYAVLMEKTNLQPAMAKVVALLNVADEPDLTFSQIQHTLGLSKGGASLAINHLLATERIDYRTKLNDRKRYFYVPIQNWKDIAAKHLEGLESYIQINQKILALRSDKSKEFTKVLKEMTEFLTALREIFSEKIK